MNSSFYLVVSGLEDIKALEEGNVSVYGVNGSYENGTTILICPVEMKSRSRFKTRLTRKSMHWLNRNQRNQIPYFLELLQTAEPHQADYQALYGGLFFLGILLGVVFILGMVLIIYYKQITEGYEDQDRFQILMKVGMTQKEVRQTINSQVMTVFFLPLVAAGIHTAFAFPMIEKMVHLLAFSDRKFLILVTVCSYLVFALFYIIVYMVTSKQYYKIVSGKQEESLFS